MNIQKFIVNYKKKVGNNSHLSKKLFNNNNTMDNDVIFAKLVFIYAICFKINNIISK